MTFNEQDHPRDEMGKFTFKNGGEEKEKDTNEKQNQKMTPFKLGAEINVYKNETLDKTIDVINSRYGKNMIKKASLINVKDRKRLEK